LCYNKHANDRDKHASAFVGVCVMPKKAVARQKKAPISKTAGFPYRLDVLVMKEGEWLVA
jgi:hypothetical protein